MNIRNNKRRINSCFHERLKWSKNNKSIIRFESLWEGDISVFGGGMSVGGAALGGEKICVYGGDRIRWNLNLTMKKKKNVG